MRTLAAGSAQHGNGAVNPGNCGAGHRLFSTIRRCNLCCITAHCTIGVAASGPAVGVAIPKIPAVDNTIAARHSCCKKRRAPQTRRATVDCRQFADRCLGEIDRDFDRQTVASQILYPCTKHKIIGAWCQLAFWHKKQRCFRDIVVDVKCPGHRRFLCIAHADGGIVERSSPHQLAKHDRNALDFLIGSVLGRSRDNERDCRIQRKRILFKVGDTCRHAQLCVASRQPGTHRCVSRFQILHPCDQHLSVVHHAV